MRILLTLAIVLPAQADTFSESVPALLEKHCVRCHGEKRQQGGITLHTILSTEDAFENHSLLENIVEQVRSGEMPPDDEDILPTKAEKSQIIRGMGDILDRIKTGDVPQSAGRVTLRRLNKNEYHYTVRDLFGVAFNPSRGFPDDGAGGEGFDNMSDALFSSPTLLEKYLAAANQVITAVYTNQTLKKQVIFAQPSSSDDPTEVARRVLTYHASLAYRKRVSEEEMAPLISAFKRGTQQDLDFQEALRIPLTALLINPRFIFRTEHDQDTSEWALNDFELATRLSYFLWSSMPDRELFKLADSGELSQPDILDAQITRMIESPKAAAFARHFGGQWIGFDKLINEVNPDKDRFPEFNRALRKSMYYEGTRFMGHLLVANRPITDLIDSDYTFANETLAKHYGLKADVKGTEMRKVPLTDKNRGGVLGMGGVLTSTSLSMRTSPVIRGAWILDALLGDPAPPPPPDAGELPADDTLAGGLTFREQLDLHRQSKNCAACHARIDPLGFSLENFDAIGRWREKDANGKILNTSAILPGDIEFSSPAELKELIMFGKDKFARNMSRKTLSYALGRPLEYYDEAIVTDLVHRLKEDDYKMQTLIKEVINSRPFRFRSATKKISN